MTVENAFYTNDVSSDFQTLSSLPVTVTATATSTPTQNVASSTTLFRAKSVTTLSDERGVFNVGNDVDDDDDTQRKSFTEFLQLHSEQGTKINTNVWGKMPISIIIPIIIYNLLYKY